MSYKITVVDPSQNLNFNARYERLDKEEKPEVVAKAPNGNVVKERTFYGDIMLGPGATNRKYVDDAGVQYAKAELTFEFGGQQVSENQQTKVFTVEGFQPIVNYTDRYCISAYYEVFPDDNGLKKDIDRKVAINANLCGMRKLWDYLNTNGVVARGVFCPSSKGFVESDGYIRAINIEGKWGIEIGQFKQEKKFLHLQETAPQEAENVVMTPVKAKIRKI